MIFYALVNKKSGTLVVDPEVTNGPLLYATRQEARDSKGKGEKIKKVRIMDVEFDQPYYTDEGGE